MNDFAKLIELFEARGVTFVSVTQQFNTTNARGSNGAVRIFFRKGERRTIRSGLRALLLGDEMRDLIDRKIAVEECKRQKHDFRNMLRKMRKEVRDQVQQLREGDFIPDFQRVFVLLAISMWAVQSKRCVAQASGRRAGW